MLRRVHVSVIVAGQAGRKFIYSGGGRRIRGRIWDTKEQCKQGKWGGVLAISYMGNSKDNTDVGEGGGGVYRSEVAR